MSSPSIPQLHDLIDVYFDDEEFHQLCFVLGGDYDYYNLSGLTKRAKVYALVAAVIRHDKLPHLLEKLEELRPAVNWPAAGLPAGPQLLRPKNRPAILAVLLILLAAIAGALTWLYFRPSWAWATYTLMDPEQLGIAVAELGISADCRRGAAGREASASLYETLESQITSVGLQRKVPLTTVGLVCNQEQAIAEGQRVAADIVIWGWVPQTAEAILGHYTFVEQPEGIGANTLAQSLELLVSGPLQERSYRLTGRTQVLVRFVLGLVYAKEKEYQSSLTMFDRAIQIIEADTDENARADSLAVLYTERGKVQAAMENPDQALASYKQAEALNPDYIGLQVALGSYYYSQRKWALARDYFDRANAHGEELSSIAYGYGLLDYYAGEYEAAVANFRLAEERALALDQEPVLAWLGMGYAYRELGRCAESAAAFGAIVHSKTAEEELRQAATQEIPTCDAASAGAKATPSVHTPAFTAVATLQSSPPLATPLQGLPAATFTPPGLPVGGPTICVLYPTLVRRGAALEEQHFAAVAVGSQVEWVGSLIAGEWYFVRLADGRAGWVSINDAAPCATLTSVATLLPIPTAALLTPTFFGTPLPTFPPIGTPPPASIGPAPGSNSPTATLLATLMPTAVPPTPTLLPTPTTLPPPTGYPPSDADSDGIPDSRDVCPSEHVGSSPDPARLGCPAPTPTPIETLLPGPTETPTVEPYPIQ